MLQPTSLREDYFGATDEYSEDYICEKCGGVIAYNEPYIENYKGDVMCAECAEQNPIEALEFVGHDNIFDILEKLDELHYA